MKRVSGKSIFFSPLGAERSDIPCPPCFLLPIENGRDCRTQNACVRQSRPFSMTRIQMSAHWDIRPLRPQRREKNGFPDTFFCLYQSEPPRRFIDIQETPDAALSLPQGVWWAVQRLRPLVWINRKFCGISGRNSRGGHPGTP